MITVDSPVLYGWSGEPPGIAVRGLYLQWEGDTLPDPGTIVQCSVKNNKVVLVPSDGKSPIGYVTSVNNVVVDGYGGAVVLDNTTVVTVNLARNLLTTDKYDISCRYPVGANVFVKQGMLTTEQLNSAWPCIAIVVKPPTAIDSSLTVLWC